MEKIKKIKKLLNFFNIDAYIIPKNDEFFGEYVDDSKDRLKFISNFSGSYGYSIISKIGSFLFVDGRYTLQAKRQAGKNFKILTIPTQMPKSIFKNRTLRIGFDPRLHTQYSLENFMRGTNLKLIPVDQNLIDKIWKRKKSNSVKKFKVLNNRISGQTYEKKIKSISDNLKKNGCQLQFISASENISWLLNIRGEDSKYSPITNSYLIIDKEKSAFLFVNLKKIDRKFKKNFKNIEIIDINLTEKFINKIHNKKILVDKNSLSVHFQKILKNNNSLKEENDIIYSLKSIKNKIEIKNIEKSHIADGAALTKFLIWVKNEYKKRKITEISAQDKLLYFRKKNKNFKTLSFPTISGSGPNGSIIHYKAEKKTNRKLKRGDIYLVDSGGQYEFGTTDVTRTLSLGNNSKRIKDIFTRVLKGHIAVANFRFKKNTTGSKIDIVARKPLKKIDLDYPHGTGHGVGYFLNVHEGPQALSKFNKVPLKEGMILSNEPGYYENGKFGIRIENLVVIKKIKKKLKFFNLTLAPIEKELINFEMLNKDEKKWINKYHFNVFNKLKNFMNTNELKNLKKACSNIN